MRATDFLTELFNNHSVPWKWSFRGSEEVAAWFKVGGVEYLFQANNSRADKRTWDIKFSANRPGRPAGENTYDLIRTGNSAIVMSTIVDITKAFLQEYDKVIDRISYSAAEESRRTLYARMLGRLLPDWTATKLNKTDYVVSKPGVESVEVTESEFSPTTLKLSNYRGSYHPETMEPYSSEFQSAFDLVDLVEEMIEDGERPTVVNIDPKYLQATQDWLSDQASDESMFEEYTDKPVVIDHNNELFILDGHKRCARALKAGKNVSVYLFDSQDQHVNESYQPPELNVGDKILKGKFKNSPAEIKGFKKDKHNQPVLKTNKGDVQLFKPRVVKLIKGDT